MNTILHQLHIQAPKEKVYEALSTVEGLSGWWTTATSGESRPGGSLQFRFNKAGCTMTVLQLVKNESVSWECTDGFADWIGTRVSIRLEAAEGKTKVCFEHSNWKAANDFFAGCSFSWGRYLESLRQLCQTGKGAAFGSENYPS